MQLYIPMGQMYLIEDVYHQINFLAVGRDLVTDWELDYHISRGTSTIRIQIVGPAKVCTA